MLLRLRILGQRDRRRPVRNGIEGVDEVFVAQAMHLRGAAIGDEIAVLLGPSRRLGTLLGRHFGDAAGGRDVEIDLAAGADDEHAPGRDRYRRDRRLRPLAGPQAGKDHRRLRGIAGRRYPGVEPEIRRQDDAVPVEGGGDALGPFAAGGDEGGGHQDQHQRAQRHGIAPVEPRRRPAGAQAACREQRPLDMGAPQRHRARDRSSGSRAYRRWRSAGRWAMPALRSRRRNPSWRDGKRTMMSGTVAATASTRKAHSPIARRERRQPQPQPEPRQARNSPIAVAMAATAGHSRSQNVVHRARTSARSSISPAWRGRDASLGLPALLKRLSQVLSAYHNIFTQNAVNTKRFEAAPAHKSCAMDRRE